MENLAISISKEAARALPPVQFDGGIQVVDTLEKARVALRELRRARVVGFDTETRPSFRKGLLHNVALMQLSTDDFCFLFRLNKIGLPDSLRDFIDDPAIAKVGLSVHDDFNVIGRSATIDPHGFIELQDYVRRFHITDASLQKIYAIVFGQCISKNQRLTNWEADELTEHQQRYAAIDAWACLRIYKYLGSGQFRPEDSPYLTEPESEQVSETNQNVNA